MKRIILLLLLLFPLLAISAQTAGRTGAQPERSKIRFEKSVAEVGRLSAGKKEKRTAKLVYTNVGNAPLVIESAEVGCECTKVKYSTKPLKPGKKAKLLITVDATDMEDRGVYGNVITIYTNAPQKYIRIRVTGQFTD